MGVAGTLLDEAIDVDARLRDRRSARCTRRRPGRTASAGGRSPGGRGGYHTPTRSFGTIRGDAARDARAARPHREPRGSRAATPRRAQRARQPSTAPTSFWVLARTRGPARTVRSCTASGADGLTGYVALHADGRIRTRGTTTCGSTTSSRDDRASAIALWRFIGGHSMQVEQVQLALGALPSCSRTSSTSRTRPRTSRTDWMHRIVDLPAAIGRAASPPDRSGAVRRDRDRPARAPGRRAHGASRSDGGARRRRPRRTTGQRGHPRHRRTQRAGDRGARRTGLLQHVRPTQRLRRRGRRASARLFQTPTPVEHRRLLTVGRSVEAGRGRAGRGRSRGGP